MTIAKRIKTALSSGSRAAYLGILVIFLRPFCRVLDSLIAPLLRMGRGSKVASNPGVIVLVTNSRTGATFINQVLVRTFKCVYHSNFHVLFPTLASLIMNRRGLFGKNEIRRRNFYGYTASLYDLNEAFDPLAFVYKEELSDDELKKEFRRTAQAISAASGRPLFVKSIRCYEHVQRLSRLLPEVRFVHVRRNALDNAGSLYRAFKDLGGINPLPKDFEDVELNTLDRDEVIGILIEQIKHVNGVLASQIEGMDSRRKFELNYEDFCARPMEKMKELREEFGLEWRNESAHTMTPTVKSTTTIFSNEEKARITKAFE